MKLPIFNQSFLIYKMAVSVVLPHIDKCIQASIFISKLDYICLISLEQFSMLKYIFFLIYQVFISHLLQTTFLLITWINTKDT